MGARTFVGYEESDFVRRERLVGIVFLAVIAICTTVDVVVDMDEGAPWTHMLVELAVVALSLLAGVYLWFRMAGGFGTRTAALRGELEAVRKEAGRWREEAAAIGKGLTAAIERQLEEWGLSPAEREIAFLLIKGLSLREVAAARKTSERTVRQQAATVYKKSGLEGRAQLSAFFLEDLFAGNPVP
jgi:DNA-binding CsgD family transcriptional regulator